MKFDDFSDCQEALQYTSQDTDKNKYMTQSQLRVYNFDEVKKKFKDELNLIKEPKSVDALIVTQNNKQLLIEFKNTEIKGEEKKEVCGKIFDSIFIIISITEENILEFKNKSKFILVYNGKLNGDIDFMTKLNEDGRQNKQFDLSGYENKYFEKIRLYNEYDFNNLLIDNNNNWDTIYSKI